MVETKMVKGLAPDLYDVRPCYMIGSNPKTRYNTRAMQNAVKVQVVNVSDKRKLEFESIKDASKYLGIAAVSVRKAIDKGYTVRKEWKVYEL